MIKVLYQAGNGHNSSPTLEVGVFLLEEDKKTSAVGFPPAAPVFFIPSEFT